MVDHAHLARGTRKGKIGERGQAFLVELMAAIVLFSLLVISTNHAYESTKLQFGRAFAQSYDRLDARVGAERLLSTTGKPSDWHVRPVGDLISPGVLDENGQISEAKLKKLVDWLNDDAAYDIVRFRAGVGTNDIFVRMTQPVTQYTVPQTVSGDGAWNTCANTLNPQLIAACGMEKNGRAVSRLSDDRDACGGKPLPASCAWLGSDVDHSVDIVRRASTMKSPWTGREEVRLLEIYLSSNIG